MKMKGLRQILTGLALLLAYGPAFAQLTEARTSARADSSASSSDALVPEDGLLELDTLALDAKPMINDYLMIGVNYGVTFSTMSYSPTRHNRAFQFHPNHFGIQFTMHSKMFGFIPNFALVLGVQTGTEGYGFKANPTTGYIDSVDGAETCMMRVIELPAMAQIHADMDPFKLMVNVGPYGGYRYSISRSGPSLDPQWEHAFRDYERRWDYGLQGGLGFALMFDPIEIHVACNLRWSWSSLYEPDYHNQYYFHYAYPLDIFVTAGVHFQLTKRRGKTRSALRQEAYDYVYGTTQDSSGQGRQ